MDKLELVLGIYDDPEKQRQKNYSVDLFSSNVAIFGTSMSGKTTMLKTLLLRLHQVQKITDTEEIYILDFSNNLHAYKDLPYVVAYFDAFQEENVRRIFKTVEDKYSHNIRALPGKSYTEYEIGTLPKDRAPHHITFIIDGLNAFMSDDKYSVFHDTLQKLARDGLSKGITIVFSANDSSNGISRMLSAFGSIIAFDLPKDQYSDLFGKKVEKPISIKGRGMVNLHTDVYEFQAYYPYNLEIPNYHDEDAVNDIRKNLERVNCERMLDQTQVNLAILAECDKRKMKMFDTDLTKDTWEKYVGVQWSKYREDMCSSKSEFTAGLDYYTFEPIKIDLLKTRSIAIYGKKASGKTNLLSLLLETASEIPNAHFVFWEDGRHGLSRNAEAVDTFINNLPEENKDIFEKWEDFSDFIESHKYYEVNKPILPPFLLPNNEPHGPFITLENDPLPFISSEDENPVLLSGQNSNDVVKATKKEIDLTPYPFTVFVIQSRIFYQQIAGGDQNQYINKLAQFITTENANAPKIFIFSDVQRITDAQLSTIFNNCIDHAFLLYDILRFVNDRGQRSVFGSLDPIELKEKYGRCEMGDGFYFNLELEEHTKLKFIKHT